MKKIKSGLLFVISLMIFTLTANAQHKVSGVVTDTQGETLPGVNILIKGTTFGTSTDFEGKYTVTLPQVPGTLIFRFVGYQEQEVKIDQQKTVNVKLKEESTSLEEVVVIGYGEMKKGDVNGAVAKANMEDMLKTPIASFDQALAGRVAGVQVTSGDGTPGSGYNIVIRGSNSLTQSNSPLFVIDGFPVEDANAAALNPSDIESVNFLMDASATAIYGARGANGVVIITTKKGKIGKPTITYTGSVSIEKITQKIDLLSPYEFVQLQTEMFTKAEMEQKYLKDRDLESWRGESGYDWQDEIFRTAITNNHYLSLAGGTQDTRYSASLSYLNQQGIITNSSFQRYQGRFNLDQKINKKFRVNLNTNYARSITNGTSPSNTTQGASGTLMYSVWGYRPVTYDDTDLRTAFYDPEIDGSNDYRFNPILSAKEEYRKNTQDDLMANAFIEYTILDGLRLKVSGGYRIKKRLSESFNNSKTRYGNPTRAEGVNASLRGWEDQHWLNENTLNYNKRFRKHTFGAVAGITFQKDQSYYHRTDVQQISNENLGMSGLDAGTPTIAESSISEAKLMSYLGRVTYNYASKYFLTASFRADGSSKFRKTHRWGYFSSGSLGWNFNKEDFLKNVSWLSNGKLRVSWGQTGNNRVNDFASLAQMSSSVVNEYPFNDNYSVGYVYAGLGNKDLKWETTEQTNLGLDLGFFDERIALNVDIYRKTTKDLLLYADLPATSGFTKSFLNIGKMRNQGLEIVLNTVNVKSSAFQWTTNFNIAFNQSKIMSLTQNQETLATTVNFDNHYTSPAYISQVGRPVGLMYGFIYDGTYKYEDFDQTASGDYILKATVPNNGEERGAIKPGHVKYRDINGDGIVNDDDRTIIGRGHPIHTGGFTNNFTYKNFELSVFFQWSYGNDILNANRLIFENGQKRKETNMFASYANRWTPENPTSDIPCVNGQGPEVFSSRVVEDGSYLRLKNVSLGYNFPQVWLKRIGISAAKLYVSGDNLITFTNYSGYDPEVSTIKTTPALNPGFDYSAYPRAYNISVGINITL